jgi:hypothetical protein
MLSVQDAAATRRSDPASPSTERDECIVPAGDNTSGIILMFLGWVGSARYRQASRSILQLYMNIYRKPFLSIYCSTHYLLIHSIVYVGSSEQTQLVNSVLAGVNTQWWKRMTYRPRDNVVLFTDGRYNDEAFCEGCYLGRLQRAEYPLEVSDVLATPFLVKQRFVPGNTFRSGDWTVKSKWKPEQSNGCIVLERADEYMATLYDECL